MFNCKFCYKSFNRKYNCQRHEKKCIKIKITPNITPKKYPKNNHTNVILAAVADLKKEISELKLKSNITINNTNVTNNVNNNVNNIVITQKLPESFHQALVDKIGIVETTNLCNEAASENNIIKIYKTLFPPDQPDKQPIIYHENTFKYLDKDNNIVADDDIINIVTSRIQNTMLLSAHNLIIQSIQESQTKKLYEFYNIRQIQKNSSDYDKIKESIITYLKLINQ